MGTKLGWGQGKATYYRVPPRLGICKEKKSSHYQGGIWAACLALPHPTAGKCPPSTAPRVEVGPSSDLTLENSGWVSGPAQGLTSQAAREQGSHPLPANTPSAHRTPPPTHSHTCTGRVQDQLKRPDRVRSCCHRPGGCQGQKRPEPSEQHVKLNHTGGPHGDRERVVGSWRILSEPRVRHA